MQKIKFLFLIIFSSLTLSSFGQNKTTMYNAYINNNMSVWKSSIIKLESKRNKTDAEKLTLIDYEYIYIQHCIKTDKDKEVEKYIQKIEKIISYLDQKNYKRPILYAYKSAVIGFKISLAPYKAPKLGGESSDFAEKSVKLNNKNYFGYIQLGNIAFYKPSIFGGSKKEALTNYLKAYNLIKDKKSEIAESWNYLNLLAMLAKTYYELDNYQKAKEFCEIALKAEPNYKFVKDELYPQVLKKI